jgi:hypothetical protein
MKGSFVPNPAPRPVLAKAPDAGIHPAQRRPLPSPQVGVAGPGTVDQAPVDDRDFDDLFRPLPAGAPRKKGKKSKEKGAKKSKKG